MISVKLAYGLVMNHGLQGEKTAKPVSLAMRVVGVGWAEDR